MLPNMLQVVIIRIHLIIIVIIIIFFIRPSYMGRDLLREPR
jgi:hypothetical protein